jgi:hypothetical protein
MKDLRELGQRGAADSLAGGIRGDELGITALQGQQPPVEGIILAIRYLWVIQDIIAVGMIVKLLPQEAQALADKLSLHK